MGKRGTEQFLKNIISGDNERIVYEIADKATLWAIAGCIEEANDLLTLLNSNESEALQLPGQTLKGFEVLWSITNKKPTVIASSGESIETIEKENWDDLLNPYSWSDLYLRQFIHKPLNDLAGHDLFVKALFCTLDKSASPTEILNAFSKCIYESNPVGYSYFHSTACATLFAAKYGSIEEAENYIRLWGEGYLKYPSNHRLSCLIRDQATAKILLTGILGPVFGLDKFVCRKEFQEIKETLAQRKANGKILVYNKLTWRQILKKASKIAIQNNTYEFTEVALKTLWLGRPPATKAAINIAESRLNIKLPNDYKKFLLNTNGFDCFSSTGVTLLPVEKIDYLNVLDRELIDIYCDARNDDKQFKTQFRNSLLIGGYEEEQYLLLVPLSSGNFECWFFSSWVPGERKYDSFRQYVEQELLALEGAETE